ncbi:MAG: MFS transporter [Actinobacteria bacterium]|nr:MFS transporter [Actinomycetota bacterium]
MPADAPPVVAPHRGLRRALAPFRHAAYRRLAVALVFSTFASGVWAVAIVWDVIRIGGGPGQLSVVAAAGTLGVLIPALLGGVVADRVPQKLVLLCVAGAETVGMALAAVLAAGDRTGVVSLAAISFVLGVAMAFYYPAYSAWLPALVPAEELQAVNGFEGMVRPGVHQAIGPAVAGAVVAALNPAAAMTVAAVASGLGLLALTSVPRTALRRAVDGGHTVSAVFRDLREAVRYLFRTPWLLATLLFASLMILVMMGPLEVLIPFLIKDTLGGGARDHSYVLAAFGVGGAAGSFAMAARRMPRRYLSVMILLWGLACLPFALIATTRHIAVLVGCGLVMGVMFGAPQVIWGTLLQRRVPPELLGRVSSLDFFVSISLMPASMALAGPVSHAIGLRNTFLIAAFAPPVFAVAAVLLARLPADEVAHPLDDVAGPAQARAASA